MSGLALARPVVGPVAGPVPAADLGESPVWDDQRGVVWWVDARAPALHRTDPATGATRTWPMPRPIGSLALRRGGGLLLALKDGLWTFDPRTGTLVRFASPEDDRPGNKLNDGKAGPDGRFFVGSTLDGEPKAPTGALYRVETDGTAARIADGMLIPNGLAWSPDGRTLYNSDSRALTIWAWDYDPRDGRARNRRSFARLTEAEGRPDGAATDAEGGLWSAGAGAGRLNRFRPDGTLDRVVEMPVRWPTMPCFGGPGLRTLYVTTLRRGPYEADAGRLLTLDVGVEGAPVGRFGG